MKKKPEVDQALFREMLAEMGRRRRVDVPDEVTAARVCQDFSHRFTDRDVRAFAAHAPRSCRGRVRETLAELGGGRAFAIALLSMEGFLALAMEHIDDTPAGRISTIRTLLQPLPGTEPPQVDQDLLDQMLAEMAWRRRPDVPDPETAARVFEDFGRREALAQHNLQALALLGLRGYAGDERALEDELGGVPVPWALLLLAMFGFQRLAGEHFVRGPRRARDAKRNRKGRSGR